MEVLDTSIANVALPHIAGRLAVSLDESTWVLTTYLVANVIVLPISGWISNTIGRKRVLHGGHRLVHVQLGAVRHGAEPVRRWSSFACCKGWAAAAWRRSPWPSSSIPFPSANAAWPCRIYGVTVLVAPILGPVAGGWITDNYTWRWIFYINLPVGIVSFFLVGLVLEETVASAKPVGAVARSCGGSTTSGLALLAVGLGSLEVVYDRGNRLDWFGSKLIVRLTVIAVVSLVAVVVWELRLPPADRQSAALQGPQFRRLQPADVRHLRHASTEPRCCCR